MGSKNRIAREIIDNLPSGEVFVDLFCGGCAVTHAALLSNKYRRFIANDINCAIPHLFKNAIGGKYKDEKRWISRDDFERLKSSDPYVACCWSFGNNGQGYMYSKEIEPWKKALHWARVFGDSSLLRKFGIDSDGSRKDVKSHHYEYKKKTMRNSSTFAAKRGTESTDAIHAPAGFKSESLRNVTQARRTPRIA